MLYDKEGILFLTHLNRGGSKSKQILILYPMRHVNVTGQIFCSTKKSDFDH